MRAQRRPRVFWEKLVEELLGSGETRESFCSRKGLDAGTFAGWFYRIRKERGESPSTALVPVVIEPSRSPAVGMPVEIDLPGRITLRFAAGTEAKYVGALVDEVARRC